MEKKWMDEWMNWRMNETTKIGMMYKRMHRILNEGGGLHVYIGGKQFNGSFIKPCILSYLLEYGKSCVRVNPCLFELIPKSNKNQIRLMYV